MSVYGSAPYGSRPYAGSGRISGTAASEQGSQSTSAVAELRIVGVVESAQGSQSTSAAQSSTVNIVGTVESGQGTQSTAAVAAVAGVEQPQQVVGFFDVPRKRRQINITAYVESGQGSQSTRARAHVSAIRLHNRRKVIATALFLLDEAA